MTQEDGLVGRGLVLVAWSCFVTHIDTNLNCYVQKKSLFILHPVIVVCCCFIHVVVLYNMKVLRWVLIHPSFLLWYCDIIHLGLISACRFFFFSQVGWSAVTVESSPIFPSRCYSDLGHHLFPVCCLIANIGTFMMGDSQRHRAITMILFHLLQNPPATAFTDLFTLNFRIRKPRDWTFGRYVVNGICAWWC